MLLMLALPVFAMDSDLIETAVSTEIERAMTGLAFPGQPKPHHITSHLLTGNMAEVWATDGALVFNTTRVLRSLRTEVRVGTPQLDSGNFDVAIGQSNGIYHWGLGHEDSDISIRKGLWISMDKAYKGATEAYAAKVAARRGRDLKYTEDFSPAPVVLIPYQATTPVNREQLKAHVLSLTEHIAHTEELDLNDVAGQNFSGSMLVQDSAGTRTWLPQQEVVIRAQLLASANDGTPLKNDRSWVAKNMDALPALSEMNADLKAAADWMVALQNAPTSEEYLGPVLFEPEASAELFRQLLQPQICGTPPFESAPDGASHDARPVPSSRIGRRVLPSGWTVIDQPQGDPSLASHMTHDFEGVASRTVELVKEGVLRDVLMSRTPRSDRSESTGHARNMRGARFEAMPTQITIRSARPKSWTKLRRLAISQAKTAGLPYVLVVKHLTPPALMDTLEFSITGDGPMAGLSSPTEVYRLYTDGREEPVRGLEFVGVDRRVLRDIVASGRTSNPIEMLDVPGSSSRFESGWFEGLPVSWSVPPVLIDELELHSRSGGEPRVISRPQ